MWCQATQLCFGCVGGAESPCFLCGVLLVADVSSAVQSSSFFGVVDGRRQRRDKNFSRTRSLRDPSATRRRISRSTQNSRKRINSQEDNHSISPGDDHPNSPTHRVIPSIPRSGKTTGCALGVEKHTHSFLLGPSLKLFVSLNLFMCLAAVGLWMGHKRVGRRSYSSTDQCSLRHQHDRNCRRRSAGEVAMRPSSPNVPKS